MQQHTEVLNMFIVRFAVSRKEIKNITTTACIHTTMCAGSHVFVPSFLHTHTHNTLIHTQYYIVVGRWGPNVQSTRIKVYECQHKVVPLLYAHFATTAAAAAAARLCECDLHASAGRPRCPVHTIISYANVCLCFCVCVCVGVALPQPECGAKVS